MLRKTGSGFRLRYESARAIPKFNPLDFERLLGLNALGISPSTL